MIFTDIDEDFVLLASVVNGDFFKGMRNAKVVLIFKKPTGLVSYSAKDS